MIYSARKLPGMPGIPGGFVFASEDGKRHECCAGHKTLLHEKEVDADACFYVWAMAHTEEYTVPPDKDHPVDHSACQLYPCDRKTVKGLRNSICPHGRYLCDEHRKPAIFAAFLPFSNVGYDISG